MRPRFLLLLMMLMACAAAPGRALAQSGPLAFNAQLFRPAIGPEDVITVVGTRTQGALQPMAHLLFDFGYRLVYLLQVDGSLLASPVETMTTAHLMGGVGLTRFWALSLDLPVVLYQSGGQASSLVSNTPSAFGVGDLRLVTKLRLRDNARGGLGLAFAPQATFPTGSGEDFRGSSLSDRRVFLLEPRFALDYRFARGAFVAANLGFEARLCSGVTESAGACDQVGFRDPETAAVSTVVSHNLTYGLGAAVPIKWGVSALAELIGKASLAGDSNGGRYLPLEVYLGARWTHRSGLTVSLGGGGSSAQATAGSPLLRVFAGVGYLPLGERPRRPRPLIDRDRDGVMDGLDACPDEAGQPSPEPWKNGCPQDTDEDGVTDERDRCPQEPQGPRPDPRKPGCPLKDTDEDGVFDDEDQCPETPAGEQPNPRKPGCPLVDHDGDGVYDDLDQCPAVPAGPHPMEKRAGCPDTDSDGDGVFDSFDACPRQPGPASAEPKQSGCPSLAVVKDGLIVIAQEVYFAPGSADIPAVNLPVLQAVADVLRAALHIKKVRVEGHTGNRGARAANLALSKRRAEAVRRWLSAHKVSEGRLEAKGFGAEHPIADNRTVLGQAFNNRVVFRILDPAPKPSVAPPRRSAPAKPQKGTSGYVGIF